MPEKEDDTLIKQAGAETRPHLILLHLIPGKLNARKGTLQRIAFALEFNGQVPVIPARKQVTDNLFKRHISVSDHNPY